MKRALQLQLQRADRADDWYSVSASYNRLSTFRYAMYITTAFPPPLCCPRCRASVPYLVSVEGGCCARPAGKACSSGRLGLTTMPPASRPCQTRLSVSGRFCRPLLLIYAGRALGAAYQPSRPHTRTERRRLGGAGGHPEKLDRFRAAG